MVIQISVQMQALEEPWYAIWVIERLHFINNHMKDRGHNLNDGSITLIQTFYADQLYFIRVHWNWSDENIQCLERVTFSIREVLRLLFATYVKFATTDINLLSKSLRMNLIAVYMHILKI